MGTLIENLNYIDAIKSDIKSAIEDKGVDMTGYSFPDYPYMIGQIPTGGGGIFDQISITTCDFGDKISILSNSASFVGQHAFFRRSDINEVHLPDCTDIQQYAFHRCLNLTTVDLPACFYINSTAFDDCSSLVNLSLPVVEYIWWGAFESTGISSLYLPVCKYIDAYAFTNCPALEWVSLPECSEIGHAAFRSCGILSSVYLGYSGVVSTTSSLSVCPLPSDHSVTVYVPSSLVSDYQAHSIWGIYDIQSLPS